jgi:hypothetical protein
MAGELLSIFTPKGSFMTNRIRRSFFIPLTFSLLAVIGCASAPQQGAGTSDANESELSQSPWLQELPQTLSENLCDEKELFRSCYPVTPDECQQQARKVAAGCQARLSSGIPENMSEAQAKKVGGQIGQCAGEALYQLLDDTYPLNETAACKAILDEAST